MSASTGSQLLGRWRKRTYGIATTSILSSRPTLSLARTVAENSPSAPCRPPWNSNTHRASSSSTGSASMKATRYRAAVLQNLQTTVPSKSSYHSTTVTTPSSRRAGNDNFNSLLSCSLSRFRARLSVSAGAEGVSCGVRAAGGRTRRRRLNKLSCAGWIPHDRGSVRGCLDLEASVGLSRLITGLEGSPPRSCLRRRAPLDLLASGSPFPFVGKWL